MVIKEVNGEKVEATQSKNKCSHCGGRHVYQTDGGQYRCVDCKHPVTSP